MLIMLIILCNLQIMSLHNVYNIKEKILGPSVYLGEDIEGDAKASVPDLIKKHGYAVEVHQVTTKDGYILEMHRIPKPGGKPVILQHGVMDSSACWVLMGPKQGLAFILSDLGYDVWMGNNRGNHYSRKHVTLTDTNKKFWDFTWHEMGIFDLPSIIDYVLDNSEHDKLHYIAHSQGTTIFWVMCSELPHYNDKILSMQAMAPVAYLDHVKSPFIIAMTTVLGTLNAFSRVFGINEFLPRSDFLLKTALTFCHDDAITQFICSNIIFLIGGYNPEAMNTTMLPVIIGHTPAGAAVKQMLHFGQVKNSGVFRQYDYGMISNWRKYGQLKPPQYNFTKVKAPVYFHYAENDWMADTKDVDNLYEKLPSVEGKYLVANENFSHLDFLWAKTVKHFVYDRVIGILEDIENQIFDNS